MKRALKLSTKHIACGVTVFALLSFCAPAAHAFNPFKAIGDAVNKVVNVGKSVMSGVGSFLGSGPGGFIGAATAPAINQFETAGHQLLDDADHRFDNRIKQLDTVMDKRIGDIDLRLQKRIEQVDDVLKERIKQVDTVLQERIAQVDGVMKSAVADVDGVLQQRINQLDEVAEKRIASLDVVATKAGYTFEESLTRFLGVGCLMVFCACAVWRLYIEIRANAPDWQQRLIFQIGGAAVSLLGLWLIFSYLPGGATSRVNDLARQYEKTYNRSLIVFDVREARFQGSQLHILKPTDSRYHALSLKADLFEQVLSRPLLLQTVGGVNHLGELVTQIEELNGDSVDPDIEAIKGLIHWRMGPTSFDEYFTAIYCAKALRTAGSSEFALRSIAIEYLGNYLHRPLPSNLVAAISNPETYEKLNADYLKAIKENDPREKPTPLSYVFRYNSLVRDFNQKATTGYLELLAAQTNFQAADIAAQPAGLEFRKKAAADLISIFKGFLEHIDSDDALRGTTAPLAAMMLNDGIQARAMVYTLAVADDLKNPVPGFLGLAPALRQDLVKDLLRVKIYNSFGQGILSQGTRDIVDYQEFQRFVAFEKSANEFEVDYLDFSAKIGQAAKVGKLAAPNDIVEAGFKVALKASLLGLYDYREAVPTPLSETIIKQIGENTPPKFLDSGVPKKTKDAAENELRTSGLTRAMGIL